MSKHLVRSTFVLVSVVFAAAVPRTHAETPQPVRSDRFGDPLPAKALARLGTVRFRHESPFRTIAFAPDSKTVATSTPSFHYFWDVATGREVRRIDSKNNPNGSSSDWDGAWCWLAYAPDGKTMAGAYDVKTVCLWECASAKEIRRFIGHEKLITHVLFTPDGKSLIVRDLQSIRQWDVATGQQVRQLDEGEKVFRSLAISADGRTLAAGDKHGIVEFWDLTTGQSTQRLKVGKDTTGSANAVVAFSPDSQLLAVAADRGVVSLWDMATRKHVRQIQGGLRDVATVAFDPTGKTVGGGTGVGSGKMLGLWDTATGKFLRTFGQAPRWGCSGSDFFAPVVFSPDGKLIAGRGPDDHVLRLWEVASGKEMPRLDAPLYPVELLAASADGRTVVAHGIKYDDTIRLWDTETGQLRRLIPGNNVANGLSLAGSTLAACWGENLRRWDVVMGKELAPFKIDRPNLVTTMASTPDGQVLAAGCRHGLVLLIDGRTGQVLRQLQDPAPRDRFTAWDGVSSIAFSSDGRLLAVMLAERGRLILWEVATGKQLWAFTWERGFSRFNAGQLVALSPDGKTVAAINPGWFELTLFLFETASGKVRGQLKGHESTINALIFSADGRRLMSGSYDKTIRFWDLDSNQQVGQLSDGRSSVSGLALLGDGRRVAAAHGDTSILVWDIADLVTAVSQPATELTDQEQAALWADLAHDDAGKANRAVRRLLASPRQAVHLLRQHLRPTSAPDDKQVARWIADLESAQFAVRQKATDELENLGELAETPLRQVLAGKPNLDLRQRVEETLEKLNRPTAVPEQLRSLRAVEVLEGIGTPEARQILDRLGQGTAAARLTVEAKAAVDRLTQRWLAPY